MSVRVSLKRPSSYDIHKRRVFIFLELLSFHHPLMEYTVFLVILVSMALRAYRYQVIGSVGTTARYVYNMVCPQYSVLFTTYLTGILISVKYVIAGTVEVIVVAPLIIDPFNIRIFHLLYIEFSDLYMKLWVRKQRD